MRRYDYIAILGPTATGKTQLALELSGYDSIEIVSVDSVSVYQGLDVASAKPSQAEQAKVPHHLIDVASLQSTFTVGDFVSRANALVKEIKSRGSIPVFCGGSMMYMHAFCHQYHEMPVVAPSIEADVRCIYEKGGVKEIYQLLKQEDPVMADRLSENDQQRLQRALAVWRSEGKSLCDFWSSSHQRSHFHGFHYLLMVDDRQQHRKRITDRVEKMLQAGLIDEVMHLLALHGEDVKMHPAMRSIGYKQAVEHICDQLPLEKAKEQIITATSQLTKKQMTWLKKWSFETYSAVNLYSDETKDNLLRLLLDYLKE